MNDRAGFTLLELIIGITIAGMAVATGYSALATMMDRQHLAQARLTQAIVSSNTRSTLRAWLGGGRLMVDEGGPSFTGIDGNESGRSNDVLTLLTGADTPMGYDVMLKLYVDRDPETPDSGLVASFEHWRGSERRTLVVDDRVTSLDIRYHSPGLAIGENGWVPSWISRTVLPRAMEVALSGDSLPPLLRLPMLIPLEAVR